MKDFDHPNVLRLLGVCVDAGPSPYMVIPYMANGSLLAFLKKERESLLLLVDAEEEIVRNSALQMPFRNMITLANISV